ncbi:hypothetical protein PIB30_037818 [Stylosanthes scabra]|uniref:Uncharacterized protein n=1 Tax=Stylosanthes scabra TaxID=79078 RepID=A0ABU6REC3_9FABA|nr:hypothetical protein [Stylosanthes scabra]
MAKISTSGISALISGDGKTNRDPRNSHGNGDSFPRINMEGNRGSKLEAMMIEDYDSDNEAFSYKRRAFKIQDKLKIAMRNQFLPSSYRENSLERLRKLKQGAQRLSKSTMYSYKI